VLSAVVAVLLPGISAFAWLATENGLEALWGLAALYVATSRRSLWVAAPVAAGVAVSAYGAGLAWAAAVLVVCVVRIIRSPERLRDLLWLIVSTTAAVELVLFPLVWWRGGGVVVVGGGAAGDAAPGAALSRLIRDLAVRGHSYYYFTSTPALGALWTAVVLGISLVVAAVRRPQIWPWLLTVAATVAVVAFSAGPPGVRRAIAIPVVGALALGVTVDVLVHRRGALLRASLVVAATAALVGPLAGRFVENRAALASGASAVPVDFPFPIPSGRTMPEEFAVLTAQLNAGRTTYQQVAAEREGERTLATVWLLAQRRGRDLTGLPTPSQIAELVAEGPRCQHGCHPVPGRP
jgi:hypothetical protein